MDEKLVFCWILDDPHLEEQKEACEIFLKLLRALKAIDRRLETHQSINKG